MIATTIPQMENVWNSFQESYSSDYIPDSYVFLLSALDKGWKAVKVELRPSWDQYGFIYLVTLKHESHKHSLQLIMPYNSLVTNLLQV
jgi:hypothetical protein